MAKGKKTGGRKAGSKNKRTRELEATKKAQAAKIAKALGKDAFEGDAHDLLMLVYKDGRLPLGVRLDAAKGAIKFEKPALASVDTTVTAPPIIQVLDFKLPVPKAGDKPQLAAQSATAADG